jgi:hypothetical protein
MPEAGSSGGGVDVILWTDYRIWDKIDCCHENPLRRRLVIHPEDWEGSSYRDYRAARTVDRIPIDWRTQPDDPRREYV